MSCVVTAGINSRYKMVWSLQQCMKNSLFLSKRICSCKGFSSLGKVSKTASLLRFPQNNKNAKIYKYQRRSSCCLEKDLCGLYFSRVCCSKTPAGNEGDKNKEEGQEKLSIYQKLKKMYKAYWYVLVPVHLVTSAFWFGGFYYMVVSGIDIPALLESLGAPESWIENLRNSKAGTVVLTYTLYKVATPLRYTVTIGGTTISINYLKKWGWIKPVPNKAQIMKMYDQKKDAFNTFRSSYQDKMQVTKNEFLKTKMEVKQHYIEAKKEFHKSVKETKDEFKEGAQMARKYLDSYGKKNMKDPVQNIVANKK